MARKTPRLIMRLIVLIVAVVVSKFFLKKDDKGGYVINRNGSSDRTSSRVDGDLSSLSTNEEGRYTKIENCTLVDHKHNDGDSFHVNLPDGRQQEFRLYFVDAPESAFKTYRDGKTNAARLGDQARYFGLKEQDQVVRIGRAAKAWVLETLSESSFTVYTAWDPVYEGPRVYAFVQIENGGSRRFIHELLTERGLSRIHTLKADLPDGRSMGSQLSKLRSYEREAKRAKRGAWGLR